LVYVDEFGNQVLKGNIPALFSEKKIGRGFLPGKVTKRNHISKSL